MTPLAAHPLRQLLNDEAHARPALPIAGPARLSSVVLWSETVGEAEWLDLQQLTQRLGLPQPEPQAVQYQAHVGPLTLNWSLHTEFVRYTFILPEIGCNPFSDTALAAVPADWLAELHGELLVGLHAVIVPAHPQEDWRTQVGHWFDPQDLIGAEIGDQSGVALTDLRLHPDPNLGLGFTRLAVLDRGMGERQCGRMVSRLIEIESYRMLALLALPIAKTEMRRLDELGMAMRAITARLDDGQREDGSLLAELTSLAGRLEDAIASSQYRFSAARAYYALVERRIDELRESRIAGLQPFHEFTERRLAPAMATCDTVLGRQDRLAMRLTRATALLRTRVEIEQEKQNQQLLASMDKRAALQLRLQETVEGLSVGVLSYYAVGLLSYGFKAAKAAGLPINADLVTGLAIPVVLATFWLGMRRIRHHLSH